MLRQHGVANNTVRLYFFCAACRRPRRRWTNQLRPPPSLSSILALTSSFCSCRRPPPSPCHACGTPCGRPSSHTCLHALWCPSFITVVPCVTTLIGQALWFTSDNGARAKVKKSGRSSNQASNGLRQCKSSFFEGGIRVAGLLEWPDKIKSHRETWVRTCVVDRLWVRQ